ncbi:MAG: DNA polymerase I [Verrucomicrobia bacterium]|nr:DNA polymerase I [Verrucomicrobiota bacterium]
MPVCVPVPDFEKIRARARARTRARKPILEPWVFKLDSLYLIDASGFIYRAFFAIQGLSNKEGESTGALYGFIRSYFRLIDEFHPTHIAAVFDAENNKASRLAIYSEYKAHRKPTPPELIKQIHDAREFCTLLGIPTLAIPGVEADDTMASVAAWAKEMGSDVFISSSDKDMAQLVDDKIKIINPHKDYIVVDTSKAEELYGVPPSQLRDYLAIIGDSSDNVPGIEGFGPKTAIQLLKDYGTLENIYAHLDAIGGKKAEKLTREKEKAFLSQKLVTLNTEVSFPKEIAYFTPHSGDPEKLEQFLRAKNFGTILKRLGAAQEEKKHERCANYHTISTIEELETLLQKLSTHSAICCDTETTDIRPVLAQPVGIGLAAEESDAYYIPLNGAMAKAEVLKTMKPFLEQSSIGFYGHNIKYDWHVFNNVGINIATICGDTILESYLLNAHQRNHSLDELSLVYFGKKKIETSELLGKGKAQIQMDQVPIERVAEYCCEDVEYTLKLKHVLDKEIETRHLKKLLTEVELPLIPILGKMEARGIYVDLETLSGLSHTIEKEIKILQEAIYEEAGEVFNLNSPKQLSAILFEKMLIPPLKKGRTTTLSTSADILETLAVQFPIAQKVLDYRSLEKLRSTYIDSLPQEVNPNTGRIHCQFNQSVAATGRLSCQNPNLQNIPVRSELGALIRSAFRPQEAGWSFLSADYSQIELRILAHVCEDEGLLEAFRNNVDIHRYTASEIFHTPMDLVTDEMRSRAKAVNFGIVYGQGAFGLSQALKIPISEASRFIEAYFKRYGRIRDYIESAKESARKTGRAVSLTGRERLIPDITSSNQMLRAAAERLAVNTPFQATNADIIKMAMIRIDKWLQESGLKTTMLLQIHDELLFEVPDHELNEVQEKVREYMEGVFELKVPLKVQISIGKNWMEC